MTLDMRTLAFLEPGQSWTSHTFEVGVHEGDWHWAADRYRQWATAHHRPYDGPEWVRKECDGWLGTGGPTQSYGDYVRMLDDARWLGLNYLQIWSEMIENVGPNKARKSYYCFLWPDPDRGGEAELTRAVRAVRAAGGHIGFYHNIWTWDSEMAKGATSSRPTSAFPTGGASRGAGPRSSPTARAWPATSPTAIPACVLPPKDIRTTCCSGSSNDT